MVMCRDPLTRAPRSGCCPANSWRIAMRPGISVSAILISLRPHSANERSLTTKSEGYWIAALIDRFSLRGSRCLGFRREHLRLVGTFPGEFLFLAAKMAVGGCFLIDRARQVEHLAQPEGGQVEMRAHDLRQALIGQLTRAEGFHHD